MSTKEWLLRAWQIDNEIKALENEITSAQERVLSVTAHYNDIKVQTSKDNGTERATLKYIEYKDRINRRIEELYAIKYEVADAIAKVANPTYRTLLTLRYLRCMTWEKIAEEMSRSSVWWVRTELHSKALREIRIG